MRRPTVGVKDAYLTHPISKTTSEFANAKVPVVRNADRGASSLAKPDI
jgi:hypothetical protein